MTLSLRYSATSDIGRGRYTNNQDSGFASEHLLVIADGMGGAAAGDLASAVAVQTLRRLDDVRAEDPLEALAGAVQRANDRLGEIMEDEPSREGMGTTVTAALLHDDAIGLAHIGDSRAYLLRGGELSQLTRDHTFVQGLVDEGRITASDAREHPHRSLLLRALDGRHDTEPDLTLHPLQEDDRLLLCSDGLSGVLEDAQLRDTLAEGTPDSAALELLRLALDAGGPDNITCVVADVVDGATPPDPDSAAASIGPLLVGAAAEQARDRFRDSSEAGDPRGPDTDELEPVDDDGDRAGAGQDPEALRYAPQPPKGFRWLRRLLVVTAVVAVLFVAGRLAYAWTQAQYYVKATNHTVAIYQGIDAQLPGISLSSLHESSDIRFDALPAYWRQQVTDGIDAENLTDAERILGDLNDVAATCATPEQEPTGQQTPTRTPSPTRTPEPTQTPNQDSRPATTSPAESQPSDAPTPSDAECAEAQQ